MSGFHGQVFSLPHALPHGLPGDLPHGGGLPPVVAGRHIITEDANVAPTGPNFIIQTETGANLLITES